MHDAILAAAGRAGISLTVADEVDDSGATGIIVTTKSVVGFASSVRSGFVPGKGLAAVRLVEPVPTVGVQVVWHPDPPPVVEAFLRSLDNAGPFGEDAVPVPPVPPAPQVPVLAHDGQPASGG